MSLKAPGCFLHNILLRYPLVEAGFILKSGHCFVKLSLQSGAKGNLYSVTNTVGLPALASQSSSTGKEAKLSQSSVFTKSSLESALQQVVVIGCFVKITLQCNLLLLMMRVQKVKVVQSTN